MSEVFDRYEREYAPRLRPSGRRRTMFVFQFARDWFVNGPLKDPDVRKVTARDIQSLLDLKQSEGVCARTVNLYRANLHRLFQLSVRPWLLTPANPVDGTETLRHDPREPRLLTTTEYKKLREECTEHPMLKLFGTLAWETGARSAEILQLEWSDIDFEHKLLTFANDPARGKQTKGRRSRTVPLSDAALTALREHAARFRLSAPQSSYLFKHLTANRSARPGDRMESLYLAFKKAAKASGFPELRPHDLRHSFVTRKLAEGAPVQLVSKYVGHSSLSVTLCSHATKAKRGLIGVVGWRSSTQLSTKRERLRD
jgi:integrase